MIRFGEASSSDKAAAEKKSMEFVKAERPVTQQVFNCGENRPLLEENAKLCLYHEEGEGTARPQAHERQIECFALCECKCPSAS